MAAAAAERLFSLELLVDWVRLDTELPPRAPGLAVAFCLLDFPPLLVLPPAAPCPSAPVRGAISFRRGKACLLRLRPEALRCPRLRASLLQLPGDPAPAHARSPRLLGTCDVPLVGAAGRGSFVLRGPTGERVGDLALFLRLTDLGRSPPGPAALEPGARDAGRPAGDAESSAPRKDVEAATLLHSKASSEEAPPGPQDAELDLEANTFCPPPLYYTHLTPEKPPPARGDITIEPQRNGPEEVDGVSLETAGVNPPSHPRPPRHIPCASGESPAVPVNPACPQGAGACNQPVCHPQTEQSTMDTIRQLPLLNALLIELSLLCNQPVASPTHVHPHLAWLYRTEPRAPESSAKSTSQAESKKKLAVGELEEIENSKKDKHFHEKVISSPPQRVTKGRLLYGLTNTLRLRLKQTNPDMLMVHEKREQRRKMQLQTLGRKFRVPPCKNKLPSVAEQSQKPPEQCKDVCLDLNVSLAENSDTSKQISGSFDEHSTTTETEANCANEKETIDGGENRTSNASLETAVSSANSIIPGRFPYENVLGGKMETKFQRPCVSHQEIVRKEGERYVRTTDNDSFTADVSENRLSRNSCRESYSEHKYSDDFASSCYSEDFCSAEESSRSLPAHHRSEREENQKHSSCACKSGEAKLSTRENSSEKSSVLSPPFSAGSPVLSYKRSHSLKSRDKSLEEASGTSASDLSSSRWTNEKENQVDQITTHNSKGVKRSQGICIKLKTRVDCKSSEKSQSPQTSQVSSYLPSKLSELELKALDSSVSDHFEEDNDDLGSLSISKQCKDICELVINKLPGYTV
uniref:Microtubule-associated protein 10 n=1 Tax=Jaculus jaculus TaxID=51337 RepID=A0A8C5KEF1_JACJA